jgi:glycine/D-amino acid oxidase-like deaminating enzyme
VILTDPGPITEPHPLAESTDISKIVRLDYGSDETYTAMMETALDGWRRWNHRWGTPLFHETGVMFLKRRPMAPGDFEHESFEVLSRRGHVLTRVDPDALRRRFPAWNAARWVDGYTHPEGGWAESGAVVARLALEARDAGVALAPAFRARVEFHGSGGRAVGVVADDGTRIAADHVLVTAGTWTPRVLPALASELRSIGQPVFHFTPATPSAFDAAVFPVFGGDIAETGYYGFPVHRGVVKVANHGVGREVHPDGHDHDREVTNVETALVREFLADAVPSLSDAPIAGTRVCVYGDTWDGHFWIAPDPDHEGLVVAAGGSGHAFKFAPTVGDLIADAVEGRVIPRFRWRTGAPRSAGEEQARRRSREPRP